MVFRAIILKRSLKSLATMVSIEFSCTKIAEKGELGHFLCLP